MLSVYFVITMISANASGAFMNKPYDTEPISSGVDNICNQILAELNLATKDFEFVLEECVYSISEQILALDAAQDFQDLNNLQRLLALAGTNFLSEQRCSSEAHRQQSVE